jgi:hypothetical protein
MKGDLISRSELIEIMTEEYKKHHAGDVSASGFTIAMEMVRNQPTAYDVEKVCEQINKIEVERSEYSEMVKCNIDERGCISSCYDCILNHVEMIVRNGGKE